MNWCVEAADSRTAGGRARIDAEPGRGMLTRD